jgi:phosphatidate cytidylyltransferase
MQVAIVDSVPWQHRRRHRRNNGIMLRRTQSSVYVVLVGLLPAVLGGPIFAAVFAGIMVGAYHEFVAMCGVAESSSARIGYCSIVALATIALLTREGAWFQLVLVAIIVTPLFWLLFTKVNADRLSEWAIALSATLYLGIPAYAGIQLRGFEGWSDRGWLNNLADFANPGDTVTGSGLGWFLFALLVIWTSDTFQYLVGKSIGRTKLIPHISPNKTVEGAIGGFAAASLVGAGCVAIFGLNVSIAAGFGLGAAVALAGLLGDLVESMVKRQVGVKDSGSLIPGHGGIFDRVDALVLGVITVWLASPWLS